MFLLSEMLKAFTLFNPNPSPWLEPEPSPWLVSQS